MIHREPPAWNKDAADIWKSILSEGVGAAALAHILAGRPTLVSGSNDVNRVALTAAEATGYEKCISVMLDLMEPPAEAMRSSTETFPDLDDETKWPEHLRTPTDKEKHAPH